MRAVTEAVEHRALTHHAEIAASYVATPPAHTSARCSGLAPGKSKLLAAPPPSAAHSFRMVKPQPWPAGGPSASLAQEPLPAT